MPASRWGGTHTVISLLLTAILAGCSGDSGNAASADGRQQGENQAPRAHAGEDLIVEPGAAVTLNGSRSVDPEGGPLGYAWTQTQGSSVELTGSRTPTPNFTAPGSAGLLRFQLTVTDPKGATGSDEVQVQVRPSQARRPSLSIEDASIEEGLEGERPLAFRVRLSAAANTTVTVNWTTVAGTATPKLDYVEASGTLSFAAGETEQAITIAVLGDGEDEPDETFLLHLSEPQHATLADNAATGTIRDDDLPLAFGCEPGVLCAGAAKRSIAPSDRHIAGVQESRSTGAHLQRFGLGGYGGLSGAPDPRHVHIGSGFATGNHDREEDDGSAHSTYVRALVLEQPGGATVAFVTLDAIGAGNVIQADMKRAIAAASGIAADNILIGQTHSHSAADLQGLWGGVPQTWLHCNAARSDLDGCGPEDAWTQGLYERAAAAVREAYQQRVPVDLVVAQGERERNRTRTAAARPNQSTDKMMTVLRATSRRDGVVIGTLLQYAAHPTVLGSGNRQVHADYILAALVRLEQALGGVALYYNGPIADAAPRADDSSGCASSGVERDYCRARNFGRNLGSDALALLATPEATRPISPQLAVRHRTAVLPVTNPLFLAAALTRSFNRYYQFTETPLDEVEALRPWREELPQVAPITSTVVSRVTLGSPAEDRGLEIATIPGEGRNSLGQLIRYLAHGEQHAQRPTMLLGLTHNSFGYLIPEEEYGGPVGPILEGEAPYEETVSLGPLTAPLLRVQAYLPLFDAPNEAYAPAYLRACQASPDSDACVLTLLRFRATDGFAACADPASPQCPINRVVDSVGAGLGLLVKECRGAGFPAPFCDALAQVQRLTEGGQSPSAALTLLQAQLAAATAGCDPLDSAACLFPFPSNHFTAAAPMSATIRTGRRINFLPAAMPRNSAGKPIDPAEWNRNDGFSPGAMLITRVPGLDSLAALKRTHGLAPEAPDNEVGITNPQRSLQADAPIRVFEVQPDGSLSAHPVWAELDVNAGQLLDLADLEPIGVTDPIESQRPPQLHRLDRPAGAQGIRTALIIRPAQNFRPGRRYIAVLRDLRDAEGRPIAAQPVFAACRGGRATNLPAVDARCAALEATVFPALARAGIARDERLVLAWDFTVASRENTTGRLVHMRDAAFATLKRSHAQGEDCSRHREDGAGSDCASPAFSIDSVQLDSSTQFVSIEGTLTVPSFLAPADASPQDASGSRQALASIASLVSMFPQLGSSLGSLVTILQTGSVLPPNHLYYNPADAGVPTDPALALYGDGLPDRSSAQATQATPFRCRIPASAFAAGSAALRPSLYGHGLLGSRSEVNGGNLRQFASDHGLLFCAIDWFGFAQGDAANVLSVLFDVSNFRVIPDASQQGFVHWMFLARALQHPEGFASHPAFQQKDGQGNATGVPVFDRREVFYDGNSQGGILSGPVVAVSKDINRAVFGVPGMNYSTLLRRSTDFTPYSTPLYLSYTDELDRNLVFALIQMLWDRSENNGYAGYLTARHRAVDGTEPTLDGQDNHVLLHPAFGDHQVTMWSADVMARTMGVKGWDFIPRRPGTGSCGSEPLRYTYADKDAFFASGRHPDVRPYFGMGELVYDSTGSAGSGSALVTWDAGCTATPPIDEHYPHADRFDPHSFPRGQLSGQCQKSAFLRSDGFIARVDDISSAAACKARYGTPLTQPLAGSAPPAASPAPGLLGALGTFSSEMHAVTTALLSGNAAGTQAAMTAALQRFGAALAGLASARDPQGFLGLDTDPASALSRAARANREVEAVVVTGASLPGWSVPAAFGLAYPYPSGADLNQCPSQFGSLCAVANAALAQLPGGSSRRSAHNGVIVYPAPGVPAQAGTPVDEIAAYAWRDGAWVEVPVQVDERQPYFLANGNSSFSFYSATDPELSYVWDTESWGMTAGICRREYDGNGVDDGRYEGLPGATRDPVPGLDHDDELVFMARDAGAMAPSGSRPAGIAADAPAQQLVIADPMTPQQPRYVYLFRRSGGSSFDGPHYVRYQRHANADQWIDRSFFRDDDPEKLGTSNTGYGPNLRGTVCTDGTPATAKSSNDRFPRDGVTVRTATYQWTASGRWMVRDLRIRAPQVAAPDDSHWASRPDLIDRWKGRAFQQSPDSMISLVGFEDEQVNWEANSSLIGERCGPVRCIREVWGADSGTNVTKTETFYRDAIAYRYRVRVHPIPPDGLYTSWDYNRSAMLPTAAEAAAGITGGRYFTALRPQGVPIDGENDEAGNVDGFAPVPNLGCPSPDAMRFVPPNADGRCPAFFDGADPSFNLPLAFNNWEQVSAKGDGGALVYTFTLKGPTSLTNPVVVPYYRDDACLDDGTGDDPVPRPFPGDNSADVRVRAAYAARAGKNYEDLSCAERQGAHGSHGLHFLITQDSDNAFLPLTSTEIDGEQWQFMVPAARPQNLAEPYANVVRVPLHVQASPF